MLPNETEVGETRICAGAEVTVTTADADFVGSATLFAVTVYVPGVEGAVYNPEVVHTPAVPDHVTEVLVVPVTVAVNCCVAPVGIETEPGVTVTATETGATTVTVAVADLV